MKEEQKGGLAMTQHAHHTGVAHVNKTELYYEVAGTGHPLTLIHGMLLDRRSWDDQFDVFARQYQVVRYDMQGWGESAQEQAESAFSPRQDLLSLLDYLNIQQKDIPSAVNATVRMMVDGPRRTPEQVNVKARSRITTMLTQHIQRHGDFLAHQQHMLPLELSAIKRLAEVNVPTLIVVGDEDMSHVLEMADTLESGIVHAKKVVIAGTAHHPNMEKPEEFNRVVLEFLHGLQC